MFASMPRFPRLAIAPLLVFLGSVGASHASSIEFRITGTTGDPYFSNTPTPIPQHEQFELTLQYDPAVANSNYWFPNSTVNLKVAGATVYSLSQGESIGIFNMPLPYVDFPPPVPLIGGINVVLGQAANSPVLYLNPTTSFPFDTAPENFAENLPSMVSYFSQGTFLLGTHDSTGDMVPFATGTIDSFTVVPEAASSTTLCLLVGGLLIRHRRQRQRIPFPQAA